MRIGFELELSDIDTDKKLPEGANYCYQDATIVNSNGQANDPLKEYCKFGSEITSKICESKLDAVNHFQEILKTFPEATINYKSNLHIHISDPELTTKRLKEFATYVYWNQAHLLSLCELWSYNPSMSETEYVFYEHSQLSKFNSLDGVTLDRILDVVNESDVREVTDAMVDTSRYYQYNRLGINFRQLLTLGTVEFRCFSGTLDVDEFEYAVQLCMDFIQTFLDGDKFRVELSNRAKLPKLQKFDERLHRLWELTNFQHNERSRAIFNSTKLKRGGYL